MILSWWVFVVVVDVVDVGVVGVVDVGVVFDVDVVGVDVVVVEYESCYGCYVVVASV